MIVAVAACVTAVVPREAVGRTNAEHHAPAGGAATSGRRTAYRLLGDPMTDRWGRGTVARTGGFLVAAGLGAATVAQTRVRTTKAPT